MDIVEPSILVVVAMYKELLTILSMNMDDPTILSLLSVNVDEPTFLT